MPRVRIAAYVCRGIIGEPEPVSTDRYHDKDTDCVRNSRRIVVEFVPAPAVRSISCTVSFKRSDPKSTTAWWRPATAVEKRKNTCWFVPKPSRCESD